MLGEDSSTQTVRVRVFGVTVEVTATADHMAGITAVLPPGAEPWDERSDNGRFALMPSEVPGLLEVVCDEQRFGPVDTRVALSLLDSQIRAHVAFHAPDHIFVHAGVVGSHGRAILLPGKSFAGKTTLVTALVRCGAEYWSDECAVLDVDGNVHPYAKSLSVRVNGVAQARSVESLGGRSGDRALDVAVIAFTQYTATESWAPRICTAGEGAIKLLEHTVPVRSRPEQALSAVRRAATGAVVLEGPRGDAMSTARALIGVQETAAVPCPSA
jgi:hypothetical protein